MFNKILQWNCRGISAYYEELQLLLNKFNPKVVCLQEIFLKDKNQLNIKYFQSYNHLYKDGLKVLDVSQSSLRRAYLNSKSTSAVIAVKTTLHKPVNIYSIYIPTT